MYMCPVTAMLDDNTSESKLHGRAGYAKMPTLLAGAFMALLLCGWDASSPTPPNKDFDRQQRAVKTGPKYEATKVSAV